MPVTASEGFAGRSFVLKKGNGASPEVFAAIGGARSTSLSINNNPVDVSDASSVYQKMLATGGIQSMEVSLDGVCKDNAMFEALELAAVNRTASNYQMTSGSGAVFEGTFVITSFQRTGPHDGAETFSASFSSHGQIEYTAPA